jgi:hypothetical protein
MERWEYKVISGYSAEDELNELGEEGWELVAVVAGGLEGSEGGYVQPQRDASEVYIYFKRPKSE